MPSIDSKVKSPISALRSSFRVHCGVHKYASFHEIRDVLNSNFLLCRLYFDFLRGQQALMAHVCAEILDQVPGIGD
jgi:hypothetical protein